MGETIPLFDDVAVGAMHEALRIVEALLFAASEPLSDAELAARLPPQVSAAKVLDRLRQHYAHRGVNLVRIDGKWAFRTAADLGWLLNREAPPLKKLSRAAMETLAIIAYHQPVTRADVEDIRGVALSRGVLDVLLEAGWVRLRGRRKSPGRPLTFGTTSAFLDHFTLESIADLPNLDDLQGAGFLQGGLPKGFCVPAPSDDVALGPDEWPVEPDAQEDSGEEDCAAEDAADEDSAEANLEENEPGDERTPADG